MRIRKRLVFILFFLLTAGVVTFFFGNEPQTLSEAFANGSHEKTSNDTLTIPEWVVEDIRAKMDDQAKRLVHKDTITLLQVQMKPTKTEQKTEPELAVYCNLDHKKGLFILYAPENGRYHAVYEKTLPIYSVQTIGEGSQQLVLTTSVNENDAVENKLYVLRYTPHGYREVWDGIALSRLSEETVDQIDGNVQFTFDNQLIYFQLRRTLDSVGMPLMEKSSYQLFTYNEKRMRYEK